MRLDRATWSQAKVTPWPTTAGSARAVFPACPAATTGTAVLVELRNLDALHAELHQRGYPFLNPGIGPGPGNVREMQLIDPASNRIRFYEPASTG